MSTWGCHAAMLRTLERQPPADEALVGPQASVVRRKKLSRTSQLLTSGLLDSCMDEVQPLRKMKRALADERARRRRHASTMARLEALGGKEVWYCTTTHPRRLLRGRKASWNPSQSASSAA